MAKFVLVEFDRYNASKSKKTYHEFPDVSIPSVDMIKEILATQWSADPDEDDVTPDEINPQQSGYNRSEEIAGMDFDEVSYILFMV